LKNKPNKTADDRNEYKLYRLLAEQPHISLDQLQTIKCPTLVIGGDHDVIKEEHTMLIYKNIPRAYLWILPASGHSTPVIYKDDFNKVVGRFFSTPYRTIKGQERFF
jgi:pimeloyl-ACP methyl ester carboxylesterase